MTSAGPQKLAKSRARRDDRRVRILAILVALTAVASARAEKTVAYARDQAWPAALRFLRVEANVKIVEKDSEAGYVMFELVDDKRTFRGTLEVIALEDKHVRFVVAIDGRPEWMEHDMLARLEQRLHAELGPPASPPPKPKDPPPAKDKDAPKKDDGPPISDTP
jgi:hypothetical protein